MVKANIDRDIIDTVKAFIAEVSKHYKVEYAFIFGSFAKGNQTDDSDIDVAIISSDVIDTYDDLLKMMGLRWNVDLRIEPHPINIEEFRKNETALTDEVIRTGVQIHAA
jgi:predicted nucleotidyltransferase